MGELVFGSMSSNLTEDSGITFLHHVPEDKYEQWQKEYVWDALQDQRFGQSFCNTFNIKDNIIYYERDWVRADAYIRRHYIARP